MDFNNFFQLLALVYQINGQAYHIKFRHSPEDDHSCIILDDDFVPKYRGFQTEDENEFKFSSKPAVKTPTDTMLELQNDAKVIEVFAKKQSSAVTFMESQCKTHKTIKPLEFGPSIEDVEGVRSRPPEIVKIVDGGDQQNRIDVVFMGDGYTASEREKFFSDINRLTQEMFEGVTFSSYLPLFNIWAIYVESQESGIGYNGPQNTPFRLHRESGQLRAIFTENAENARQVCLLTGPSGCDYPSIIGNDDFYGGLGGEFVISTKSVRTGTVVLRHEMGHNFVDVGEEYDNGQVYSGVNSASSLATLGWTSWLTTGTKREERAIYRLLEYPWADLSRGAKSFTFISDGNYNRWYLLVSVSAAGENDCMEFLLDGEPLPWKSKGIDDRTFYSWKGNEGFTAGSHNFTVRTKTNPTNTDIPRMICSITLHEFGSEDEFVEDNNHVSAYPTWDVWRRKVYRPTNAGCLMRNMTHERFCPVCQEGMWLQFLQRVSLIDNVEVSDTVIKGTRQVTVNTIKLGQLRAVGKPTTGEKLEIKWFLNGIQKNAFKDHFTINAVPGVWIVEVRFVTGEVRNDPTNLLTSTETFVIPPF